MAEELRGTGSELFPAWYYDPVTEFQTRRLDDEGKAYATSITKGQASDLIGLDEPVDVEDAEVLRFFKRSMRGMNQTKARHEIRMIFSIEANRSSWEDRPMDDRQREFFRFFKMKVRAGTSHKQAKKEIDSIYIKLKESQSRNAERWDTYNNILDEFEESDFRDGYDIRKPSLSMIRKAFESVVEGGVDLDSINADLIAERIVEMFPDIQR